MAKIIKGREKGREVTIMEIRGEFATIGQRRRIRLGMLEVSHAERQVILQHYTEGDTFNLYYDFSWFLQTGRFKKIQWASAR